MTAFIVRRLLLLVPVLLIVGVIVFSLLHLAPGDPASMMLGREATLEQKEAVRAQLGLDEPVPVQFATWFWGVLRLDFGESLFIGKPVTGALLMEAGVRLPVTAPESAYVLRVCPRSHDSPSGG